MAGFGDNVRIRITAATEAAGVAGLTGQVYGETTPSVTGVDVIGDLTGDYALNVAFDDGGEPRWFAPELVEFVDHAPGTEIRIGDKQWVRSADGAWKSVGGETSRPRSWIARLFGRK